MIAEFQDIAVNFNLPKCKSCGEFDFTYNIGENCMFCGEKFTTSFNENQLFYCLEVLKKYVTDINTENSDDFEELKLVLLNIKLDSDNIVDALYQVNNLTKRINVFKIRNEAHLKLNTEEILLNNEVINSSGNSNALFILGILLLSITIIQNSV